jgi:hypothetical protein
VRETTSHVLCITITPSHPIPLPNIQHNITYPACRHTKQNQAHHTSHLNATQTITPLPPCPKRKPNQQNPQNQAETAAAAAAAAPLPLPAPPLPGRARVYLANARASAFLQLTFWLPTKLSTVTAMARSMSCAEQYSDRRMRQKDSEMRIIASRWRTWWGG